MCSLWRWLVVVGFAIALVGSTEAQQRRPGGGMGGSLMLLQNEGVQKELKMTDDQVSKVKDVGKQIMEKYKDDFAGARKDKEKFGELMKKVGEESTKALADVLKPEQQKRLKQIQLQQQGTRAFQDEEVAKTLKLSDEQKTKIKDIGEAADKERRELFQGGFNEEARKKMQELRKSSMDKTLAVLNDDQKKSWKDMTGEPFEVQFQFRRPNTN